MSGYCSRAAMRSEDSELEKLLFFGATTDMRNRSHSLHEFPHMVDDTGNRVILAPLDDGTTAVTVQNQGCTVIASLFPDICTGEFHETDESAELPNVVAHVAPTFARPTCSIPVQPADTTRKAQRYMQPTRSKKAAPELQDADLREVIPERHQSCATPSSKNFSTFSNTPLPRTGVQNTFSYAKYSATLKSSFDLAAVSTRFKAFESEFSPPMRNSDDDLKMKEGHLTNVHNDALSKHRHDIGNMRRTILHQESSDAQGTEDSESDGEDGLRRASEDVHTTEKRIHSEQILSAKGRGAFVRKRGGIKYFSYLDKIKTSILPTVKESVCVNNENMSDEHSPKEALAQQREERRMRRQSFTFSPAGDVENVLSRSERGRGGSCLPSARRSAEQEHAERILLEASSLTEAHREKSINDFLRRKYGHNRRLSSAKVARKPFPRHDLHLGEDMTVTPHRGVRVDFEVAPGTNLLYLHERLRKLNVK